VIWLALLLATDVAEAKKPPVRPINLWEVEKDGRRSYLFGTCHLPIPVEQVLPAPHDRALLEASVVVTEADTKIDPIAAFTMVYGPQPSPLSARLAEEDWRALAVKLRPLPAPMIEGFPDWVVASAIAMGSTEPGAAPVLDEAIGAAGASAGARRVFLETIEEQTAVISKLPIDTNDWFRPSAETIAEAEDVMKACSTGDLTAFETTAADPDYDVLIGQRNRAWIPKLDPLLAEGGAFVAVGVGHMVGNDGLVGLLEAQGYSVERVKARVAPATVPSLSVSVPPAPPYDAGVLAAARAEMPAAVASAVCAPSTLISVCFAPDQVACEARVRRDTDLCLLQEADQLGKTAPQTVAVCGAIGLMLDAVMAGKVAPDPGCQAAAGMMGPLAPKP
jgi:uncharacterized protein YbaP (TraB family)